MKRFTLWLVLCTSLFVSGSSAHAALKATNVSFLLSQVRTSTTSLAGGKAYFYAPGTTTLKTIWLDRDKGSTANNPYTLDANGTAQVYADGLYRIVIKDAAGVTKYDRDNLAFQDAITSAIELVASDYGTDLATAVAAIGSTPASLVINTAQTVNSNTTVPDTLQLRIVKPGSLTIASGKTLTMPAPIAGRYQIVAGSGNAVFTSASTIYPEWAGLSPGNSASANGAAMLRLNSWLKGSHGAVVSWSEGHYLTTEALWVNGYGVTVKGVGRVIIESVDGGANNLALMVGTPEPQGLVGGIRLSTNMLAGATTATVTSSAGYNVDDVVYMVSGTSTNSSGINRIVLNKQFFTIAGISGNTLTFKESAEVNFNTADDALIYSSSTNPAVGCLIENITFTNSQGTFTGPYLHSINYAYGVTIRNCKFLAYSATGYASQSDKLVYDNCTFAGYSGFGSSGVKRVEYRGCSFNPGSVADTFAVFFEETPEEILIDHCTIYGIVSVGSSSDASPPKRFMMRYSRIVSTGAAVRILGFYNANGYATDFDHVVFDAPGGIVSGGPAIKAVLAFAFTDTTRITNCEFVNSAADAYAAAVSNIAYLTTSIYGNRYGTSLGLHSSMTSPANTADINAIVGGTFTPLLKFGGNSVGMVYTKQIGRYTKIGNRIFFSATIQLSAKGSSTGSATISGLPVTSANVAGQYTALTTVMHATAATLTQFLQPTITNNSTTVLLSKLVAGTYTDLVASDFTDTTLVVVSGQYDI